MDREEARMADQTVISTEVNVLGGEEGDEEASKGERPRQL